MAKSHIFDPKRIARADGQKAIVDFRKEDTDVGPPISIRVSKEHDKRLFRKRELTALKTRDLTFHYLILFGKINA
jgi:hypothetical protein